MTRGDFLGFGILGTIVGAILTIPPAAFVLGPLIDIDLRGQSDIPDDWFEVGSISEISEDEPKYFLVEFPVEQIYSQREIQEKSGTSKEEFTLDSGLWVSWKTEILEDGKYGSTQRPSFLDEYDGGSLSEEQVQEAQDAVNVLSNSCAHLGCPVRWIIREGDQDDRQAQIPGGRHREVPHGLDGAPDRHTDHDGALPV